MRNTAEVKNEPMRRNDIVNTFNKTDIVTWYDNDIREISTTYTKQKSLPFYRETLNYLSFSLLIIRVH